VSARVLQVITDADRRGAQVFAADLHSELIRQGRNSRLVALAPGRYASALNVPVLGERRLAPSTLYALRRELTRHELAIAHGSSTLVAHAAMTLASGVPFIYRQISDQLFWAGQTVKKLRVRAFLSRAAGVVALWSGAAKVLVEHFGVPTHRIRVIPNGVPASSFPVAGEADRQAARRRFGLAQHRPTLVCIGALVPEKGVDLAIAAASALPDTQLLIVGAGPEESALRALAERGAAGRVVFVPPIGDPGAAYAAADVVLLPSRGGDSMPAVLIEAALTGRAAASTRVGGIGDVVVAGRTGELAEPGDVQGFIEATSAALRSAHQYGVSAREHAVSRFEIGVVARSYAEVVEDALARAQGRAAR
jgi:glycosyltransferase involved in cell wall biosynthesis